MSVADQVGAAGTAMGSVSLFVQLFDKCTHAFSLWQEGKDIGVDAMAFQVRLDMQAARLKEWGLNWEISGGPRAVYLFEPRFKAYGDLAVQYIATINHLLDILGSTASESPALASGANFPISAATHMARLGELDNNTSQGRTLLADKINSIRDETSALQKLSWAADEGKASKALELIKSMINELYEFFKPPRKDAAAHIVLSSCLASLNLDLLNKMKDSCSDDPLLQGLAYLKAATHKLESRNTALDYIDINKKFRQLKEGSRPDLRNNRAPGLFDKESVVVEWKQPPAPSSSRNTHLTAVVIEQRIKNVGRLLKVDLKPPELRTLNCIGVVTKSDKQRGNLQYGLVFKAPDREYRTLLSLIKDPNASFDLGKRFSVAQKLTESLLFLHLSGWLHKGIRSDNVLFFGESQDLVEIDAPYIVGFEYSRESKANSETEGVTDDLEFNLYRHPDVQGLPEEHNTNSNQQGASQLTRPPFGQKHDIYSLGVVLLEIGLLKSAPDILLEAENDSQYGNHSAKRFSDWVIEREVPKLGRLMGNTYKDAVQNCLTGDFDRDSTTRPETGMYMNVLRALSACHA